MSGLDRVSEEETEFQAAVAQIGGKERILLVSDVCETKEPDGDVGLFRDFLREMFSCGGGGGEDPPPPPRRQKRSGPVDAALIIFLFRQSFLCGASGPRCVLQILKDVRTRCQRGSVPRPALLGLIRATQDGAQTTRGAQILERSMRAVFRGHAAGAIWVGSFLPNTEESLLRVKRNASKAVHAAADDAADRGSPPMWPIQCCFRPQTGEAARKTNGKPSNCRQKGEDGSPEEGLPLKTCVSSSEPHVKAGAAP